MVESKDTSSKDDVDEVTQAMAAADLNEDDQVDPVQMEDDIR